jgi:hypothetical protein
LKILQVESEAVDFEDRIRDYLRILGAVKEMLQVRSDKLALYQSYETKREKSKNSREIEEVKKKL